MSDVYDRQTGEIMQASLVMPAEIATAVVAVASKVKMLGGDAKNTHQNYSYVSIDKFIDVLGPMMAEAGLALIQDEVSAEVRGAEGKPWLFARYAFSLAHISGTSWGPVYRSVALQVNGPQTYGAAESYMMKRFMRGIFMVPTGDRDADDDPQEGGAPTRASSAPPQTQQRAQRPPAAPSDAAKQEARRRFQTMRDEIDASPTADDIAVVLASPAWVEMTEHVKVADPDKAEAVIAQLIERARARQEQMGAAPAEGYPA